MSLMGFLSKKVGKGAPLFNIIRGLVYSCFDYSEVVRLDSVSSHVVEGSLLDVGAGIGKIAWNVRERHPGLRVFAIEPDENTHKWYPEDLSVLSADGLRLPFDSDSFENVLSTDVLEHIPSDNRSDFVKELRRISNDKIILTFPVFHSRLNRIFCFLLPDFLEPKWLYEHDAFGLPEEEEVEDLFESHNLAIVSKEKSIGEFGWLVTVIQHLLMLPLPVFLLRFFQKLDLGSKTWVCYCLEKN